MEALGARGAVHLRTSNLTGLRLYQVAEKLAQAQRATESWLVVNDRLDIAIAAGARAVQLSKRSIPLADALSITGHLPLGVSIHSLEQALHAERDGAAWLVAGNVYATASHEGQPGKGEDFLAEVAWRVATPIIAIGGIQPRHLAALRRAGAHGVAAIRGIWSAEDVAEAAADYLSIYDTDGDP
jgi:thiazole tautomerase (transcriptional regulator TenI)